MATEGHFYVIQLHPEIAPDWVKLGYTSNLLQRLKSHQTTCPTAKVLQSWSCLRAWEHKAIVALTKVNCTKVGTEVFICSDIVHLVAAGTRNFFQGSEKVCNQRRKRKKFMKHLGKNLVSPQRNSSAI